MGVWGRRCGCVDKEGEVARSLRWLVAEGASDAPGATGGGSHSVYRRLSAVVVSGVEERRQKKEKAKNPKRELK